MYKNTLLHWLLFTLCVLWRQRIINIHRASIQEKRGARHPILARIARRTISLVASDLRNTILDLLLGVQQLLFHLVFGL
jgi:hypothetical protein